MTSGALSPQNLLAAYTVCLDPKGIQDSAMCHSRFNQKKDESLPEELKSDSLPEGLSSDSQSSMGEKGGQPPAQDS